LLSKENAQSNSYLFSYQYGPDTYLLQVRDSDFPARLREYLSVARTQSSEFQDVKVIVYKAYTN
jgi:hypothetical protein